jgi:2-alkyl-3-oxoalkanoate reductase
MGGDADGLDFAVRREEYAMKVLVTGGGGFLGQVICRRLVERGDTVTSFARNRYPTLEAMGVTQVQGDLSSLDVVVDALAGIDAAIHTAALAAPWGKLEDFYQVNVVGTDNLLAACAIHGIGRLVYTSTPSVIHAHQDINNGNESLPYARHFLAHYPATKAVAERRVLRANSPELATCALRPHLIWGPGDPHLLPRIVARAKSGRLRLIGKPGKRIDVVHVENAALAHVLALDALKPGAPCAGKAYFISQGEPILTEDMINRMLSAARVPMVIDKRIPYALAYMLGAVMEMAWGLLPLKDEPPMTRFIANQLATAHWFNINAAKQDLGYQPEFDIKTGMDGLSRWLVNHPLPG